MCETKMKLACNILIISFCKLFFVFLYIYIHIHIYKYRSIRDKAEQCFCAYESGKKRSRVRNERKRNGRESTRECVERNTWRIKKSREDWYKNGKDQARLRIKGCERTVRKGETARDKCVVWMREKERKNERNDRKKSRRAIDNNA